MDMSTVKTKTMTMILTLTKLRVHSSFAMFVYAAHLLILAKPPLERVTREEMKKGMPTARKKPE